MLAKSAELAGGSAGGSVFTIRFVGGMLLLVSVCPRQSASRASLRLESLDQRGCPSDQSQPLLLTARLFLSRQVVLIYCCCQGRGGTYRSVGKK